MSHPFSNNLPSNIENTGLTVMKNYTKTAIRMLPNTTSELHAGDSVVFHLPAAKVLDLASLRFEMNIETNGTDTELVGLPKYTSSLFSQHEVIVNGVSVVNLQRYGQIYNAIKSYSTDYEKLEQKQFNNADPSVDYYTDINGTVVKHARARHAEITSGTPSAPGLTADECRIVNKFKKIYTIDDYLGWLDFSSEERQSFFSTNLTGSIEIRWTLAPNNVLWVDNAYATTGPPAGDVEYTISNMLAFVDAVEFSDSSFVDALDNKISSTDPSTGERTLHLMPFKNYKSYTGTTTGKDGITTMRVVENSSSLDKLLFTYMEDTHSAIGPLQLGDAAAVTALGANFTYSAVNSIINHPNILNTSQFFKRNATALGYNPDRTKTAEIQWELDSQNLSNPMTMCSAYEETKRAFNLDGNNINKCHPGIRNFESWLNNHFLVAYSLEHVGGKHRGVVISGVDTMATAVNVCVKVSNSQRNNAGLPNLIPMLITESTSILKIGQGRSIAVQP